MESLHNGCAGSVVTSERTCEDASADVYSQQQQQASESMLDECGHPRHAAPHLKVSPISACDGFVSAAQA